MTTKETTTVQDITLEDIGDKVDGRITALFQLAALANRRVMVKRFEGGAPGYDVWLGADPVGRQRPVDLCTEGSTLPFVSSSRVSLEDALTGLFYFYADQDYTVRAINPEAGKDAYFAFNDGQFEQASTPPVEKTTGTVVTGIANKKYKTAVEIREEGRSMEAEQPRLRACA